MAVTKRQRFGTFKQQRFVLPDNYAMVSADGNPASVVVEFLGIDGLVIPVGTASSVMLTVSDTAQTMEVLVRAATIDTAGVPENAFAGNCRVVSGTVSVNTGAPDPGTDNLDANGFPNGADEKKPISTGPIVYIANEIFRIGAYRYF